MIVSDDAKEILRLLSGSNNVLVQGAPGTGKTHLVNEVRGAFVLVPPLPYDKAGRVPFPKASDDVPSDIADWLPSPDRNNRRVFQTVFHQGTKHRDFVSGVVPVADGGSLKFRVHRGALLAATEHALLGDGAALLVIEEINRGPAVAAFGGSIVSIESDKRLDSNGKILSTSSSFEALDVEGNSMQVYLPKHLYLLATMNQADTSVEALDVAFLRRWDNVRIDPSSEVLNRFYSIDPARDISSIPALAEDVIHAAICAWSDVNTRIALGRGPEFQIGHGILMSNRLVSASSAIEASALVVPMWERIRTHVEEVFFGDVSAVAEVLNVGSHNPKHPYQVIENEFAGGSRMRLVLQKTTASNLFQILRAVSVRVASD
jgi:5-methylcytosine-specific restriction protein B